MGSGASSDGRSGDDLDAILLVFKRHLKNDTYKRFKRDCLKPVALKEPITRSNGLHVVHKVRQDTASARQLETPYIDEREHTLGRAHRARSNCPWS